MTHIELTREKRIRDDIAPPNVVHDISLANTGDGELWIEIDGKRYHSSEAYEYTGDFRWRMVHTNGNVVGASTEGYKKRGDAIHNLLFVTGGRLDHGGTVLKRRLGLGPRMQKFDVRDITKEK